jgi:glutaredoxin
MINLYTIKSCPYCIKLKSLLDEANLEYNEIDGDLPENDDKFRALTKITKSLNVPTIIIGKNILVPEVSFIKIEEGFELIKSLLNK